jgi:signal transduction histidine kinase
MFFQEDMTRDGKVIGHPLAKAVSTMWRSQGLDRATTFVNEINDDYERLVIRFVWLGESRNPAYQTSVELSNHEREQLLRGPLVITRTAGPDPDYIYTFVSLQGPEGSDPAALEMRESFAPASKFIRISGLRLAAFFGVIILSTSGIMWILGTVLVARPIAQLSKKAKQIANGDFAGIAVVKGSDEIASLAADINTMSSKLSEARTLLDQETSAKIKAVEQLRHADRLATIGTLASGLAHELGTPLNVLNGHLQLTTAAIPANSPLKENIEICAEQTKKMTTIIGQLLDFSRSRTPNREWVDITTIAQRAIRTLAPFAGKRHALIKFSSDCSSAAASVDATQIEQVITNLLLNAVQSMDAGGEILVTLSKLTLPDGEQKGDAANNYIQLSVHDSGRGIDPVDAEQIFDPFFTTKEVGEGTGMGLSIAYGIVKDHGGWIDMQSRPGRGSCFSVYLPDEVVGPC